MFLILLHTIFAFTNWLLCAMQVGLIVMSFPSVWASDEDEDDEEDEDFEDDDEWED